MTAAELIRELQRVAPDTEIIVTTDAGTATIQEVVTNGYTCGKATIVTGD